MEGIPLSDPRHKFNSTLFDLFQDGFKPLQARVDLSIGEVRSRKDVCKQMQEEEGALEDEV
jgi:hypothetical protein